jgi:hypothetical protein
MSYLAPKFFVSVAIVASSVAFFVRVLAVLVRPSHRAILNIKDTIMGCIIAFQRKNTKQLIETAQISRDLSLTFSNFLTRLAESLRMLTILQNWVSP